MNNAWIGNLLHSRARIDNTKEVLIDLDANQGYTYGMLDERANRLADLLRNKYHVAKGDRVAMVSRNRIEMVDAFYATAKVGAILVPYNARLSANELTRLIEKETPKVLFFEDLFESHIKLIEQTGIVEHLVILKNNEDPSEYPDYDSETKDRSTAMITCPELELEDIHLIIHTGGTTGLPKGGLVSHRNLLFNSFNEICTWGLSHDDSTLLLLPMFHTGGWNLLTLPLLHVGGTLYINRQFDPQTTLEMVHQKKINLLFGAATIFRMMVEQPEFSETDFSEVKWVMAGAAPTPINIMEQFWDKGVKFVLGYGMTEAGPNNLSPAVHFLDMDMVKDKYASVGRPMYMTMVKLVDEADQVITEPHVPGEILWSGPQIFSGYWDNEAETDEVMLDGWVRSGDMATFDEDGFFYIVGRKKNMFISGGENVFPPEIESALYEIEAIRECRVFGVPDDKWGEVGKAVISLKPGQTITQEEIKSQLGSKLSRYKIPKYYQLVEDIPKNNVGKIVVSEVIKRYGDTKEQADR